LEDLDATAVAGPRRNIRKRRHDDDDDDDPPRDAMENETLTASTTGTAESLRSKRVRYEQVMAQGNVRSQQVFGKKKQTPRSTTTHAMNDDDDDDEPDDAFLNAAIEKARRWNRLKAMSSTTAMKGADAVVAALQQANAATTTNNEGTSTTSSKGTTTGGNRITFQMDETHEFTRTLLARTEQMEREQARKSRVRATISLAATPNHTVQQLPDDSKSSGVVKEESVDVMDVDIQELAKDVKMDDITPQQYRIGLDGTTTAVPKIGRGVGGLLQFLQHSGELSARHVEQPNQKEEMRGRARDKRTYEDYEPLDLSKVVRIDERNATAKDRELASREVKLEYRDEHGRLLTRKEAFRDLSYQFHGYGSGKRKQEKKLQQIAREQAEARITSQQLNEGSVHTTFGALKETQRATGKAFVIHKT
jgi:U4/U6.U5 tri-snRNP-associated protein 1